MGEIAAGVDGLDADQLIDARWDDAVGSEIERSARAARVAGVNGTPAFEIGPTGGSLELVHVDSLGPEGIVPAIEAALAR